MSDLGGKSTQPGGLGRERQPTSATSDEMYVFRERNDGLGRLDHLGSRLDCRDLLASLRRHSPGADTLTPRVPPS